MGKGRTEGLVDDSVLDIDENIRTVQYKHQGQYWEDMLTGIRAGLFSLLSEESALFGNLKNLDLDKNNLTDK